jgi:hypothetical protein
MHLEDRFILVPSYIIGLYDGDENFVLHFGFRRAREVPLSNGAGYTNGRYGKFPLNLLANDSRLKTPVPWRRGWPGGGNPLFSSAGEISATPVLPDPCRQGRPF